MKDNKNISHDLFCPMCGANPDEVEASSGNTTITLKCKKCREEMSIVIT